MAFANADGGVIVIGLHNVHVEGTAAYPQRVNAIRQAPLDYTRPPVRADFEMIECVNSAGDPDTLLLVRVDPSELVHETSKGEAYLQIGDESRKLNFLQRQDLFPHAHVRSTQMAYLRAHRSCRGTLG